MAARQAHNLEAVGPSPTPAKWENRSDRVGFFIYSLVMGGTRTEHVVRGDVFRLHNAMHEPENDLVKDGSAVHLDP